MKNETGHIRRKLWQLPPNCTDLLATTSHSIDSMRLLAQKALSRVGGTDCRLTGRDADLIYSITRDFGTQNPVSEIFQRDFETRHKTIIARFSAIESPNELLNSWLELLDSKTTLAEISGGFWAALTHPCGTDAQGAIIYEMGAWVLRQMRLGASGQDKLTIYAEQLATSKLKVNLGKDRLREVQIALDAARSENAKLHCSVNGLTQRVLVLEQTRSLAIASEKPSPARPALIQAQAVTQIDTGSNWNRKKPVVLLSTATMQVEPKLYETAPDSLASTSAIPYEKNKFIPINIAGKRILCVGGLIGAQSFYKKVVEQAGGECHFHDGGLEDNVMRLPVLIDSVDIVICQTGCINHDAYQQVKRICNRSGKPCVYLERPSVSYLRKRLQAQQTPVTLGSA